MNCQIQNNKTHVCLFVNNFELDFLLAISASIFGLGVEIKQENISI